MLQILTLVVAKVRQATIEKIFRLLQSLLNVTNLQLDKGCADRAKEWLILLLAELVTLSLREVRVDLA